MTQKLNGCHDRKAFKSFMEITHIAIKPVVVMQHFKKPRQDVYRNEVVEEVTVIPFRMEMECQYTKSNLGQIDAGCEGCRWRYDPIAV